jgi:hypothetical protein
VTTNKFPGLLPGLVLLAGAILVSGCATSSVNYTGETSVLFERVPSEDALVSEVHSYEDGDELVVFGRVKRAVDNCCDAARGHVDIAVVGPDGFVLDTVSVSFSPRNIPKVRSRSSRFVTRLPYTVPDGITLRVAYHSSRSVVDANVRGDNAFACGQSVATPGVEG